MSFKEFEMKNNVEGYESEVVDLGPEVYLKVETRIE